MFPTSDNAWSITFVMPVICTTSLVLKKFVKIFVLMKTTISFVAFDWIVCGGGVMCRLPVFSATSSLIGRAGLPGSYLCCTLFCFKHTTSMASSVLKIIGLKSRWAACCIFCEVLRSAYKIIIIHKDTSLGGLRHSLKENVLIHLKKQSADRDSHPGRCDVTMLTKLIIDRVTVNHASCNVGSANLSPNNYWALFSAPTSSSVVRLISFFSPVAVLAEDDGGLVDLDGVVPSPVVWGVRQGLPTGEDHRATRQTAPRPRDALLHQRRSRRSCHRHAQTRPTPKWVLLVPLITFNRGNRPIFYS